jgi:hypothetical protein
VMMLMSPLRVLFFMPSIVDVTASVMEGQINNNYDPHKLFFLDQFRRPPYYAILVSIVTKRPTYWKRSAWQC